MPSPQYPRHESEEMPECRAFCHWLGQQFAGANPTGRRAGLPPSEAGH
ncbi:hypothetical protein JFQ93_002403 [Aeromonas sobria]|nr:hypothetical protein [Aeromonas sobria]